MVRRLPSLAVAASLLLSPALPAIAAAPPYRLTLAERTVDTTEVFEACFEIVAGDGFRIAPTGRVTLRSAARVSLGDGLTVEDGGSFLVQVDPQLCASYRLHGVDFSPYVDVGENPNRPVGQITPAELLERLERVAPYTEWVRTFGCNEDLRDAGRLAHQLGLKAVLGAWLSGDRIENQNQVNCLIAEALSGHVDVAVVGSEVLLRGDLTEAELIAYLDQVRNALTGAGLAVPVTTADVYGVLLERPAVLAAVDEVFVNYYPYWEGRSVDHAIAHLHRAHQQMRAAAPGKRIVVSETGWPSCGNVIGEAVPSPENAAFAFLAFVSWARANDVDYFYFEAFDEAWKAAAEGPQGACWGLWRMDGELKDGMEAVFAGDTMPDIWTEPPSEPVIDFDSLPAAIVTNLSDFLVAGSTAAENLVTVDGAPIGPDAFDEAGNYAFVRTLAPGQNTIVRQVEGPSGELLSSVSRTVTFDPDHSTAAARLLYVDVVDLEGDLPRLSGTVVIDVDGDAVLGILRDEHVRGVSPDGREIYTQARTVIDTESHQVLRTLPFTLAIQAHGFAVSPDGSRLYSGREIVDTASNELLPTLHPVSIATTGAGTLPPIAGDPAPSADGSQLYCRSDVSRLDLTSRAVADRRGDSVQNETDLALSPAGDVLLVASYSSAEGRLSAYDASALGTLLHTVVGLGDFAGDIRFSADGGSVLVGSAGNAAWGGGRVSVVDLTSWSVTDHILIPLAENLATSGNDELFVSSGEEGIVPRLGVQMLVLAPDGTLVRAKTFFLGVNRFVSGIGRPARDRIHRLVFRPSLDP